MTRKAARERYDAIVDLFPPKKVENFAYALVKRTFKADGGALVPIEPEPLRHDLRDPDLEPKLPAGSDFWPGKDAADVVVLGSAFSPPGRPVEERRVTVQIGRAAKRIQVWGQRTAHWRKGKVLFSEPEPFEEIPIRIENAYGGCDLRVPLEAPEDLLGELKQANDHPGLYPRNPFGKGYVVSPEPADGVLLPNLEDPAEPLTPERFVVGDPRDWWKQPLPWSLDWHHPLMFPRYVYLGADAWFPGPQDATLPEVQRGFLPVSYRHQLIDAFDFITKAPAAFFQEASLGMSFRELPPGLRCSVTGMHAEGKAVEFAVPPPPNVEIVVEGDSQRVQPRLTQVVVEPAEEKVSFTWFARRDEMPRKFVPGIHEKIALSARIDRDLPIEYETPPTVRQKLAEANAAKKGTP